MAEFPYSFSTPVSGNPKLDRALAANFQLALANNQTHTHEIADIDDLQTTLDGLEADKYDKAGGTVSGAVTSATAASGSAPGFQSKLSADTNNRIRLGLNASDVPVLSLGSGSAGPDWVISRTSASVASLASGDYLRCLQDPLVDDDLVRKVYVDRIRVSSAAKTAGYTAAPGNEELVRCQPSGGAFQITLPATHTTGETYTIKNIGASTNAITVAAQTPDTIDGAGSVVLNTAYAWLKVVSDGSNWMKIGQG